MLGKFISQSLSSLNLTRAKDPSELAEQEQTEYNCAGQR